MHGSECVMHGALSGLIQVMVTVTAGQGGVGQGRAGQGRAGQAGQGGWHRHFL